MTDSRSAMCLLTLRVFVFSPFFLFRSPQFRQNLGPERGHCDGAGGIVRGWGCKGIQVVCVLNLFSPPFSPHVAATQKKTKTGGQRRSDGSGAVNCRYSTLTHARGSASPRLRCSQGTSANTPMLERRQNAWKKTTPKQNKRKLKKKSIQLSSDLRRATLLPPAADTVPLFPSFFVGKHLNSSRQQQLTNWSFSLH